MKYVIDIDGTICTHERDYSKAKPFMKRIKKINRLYTKGNEIIFHTARGYETRKDWLEITENQLKKWNVNYHKLIMNKPSADVYIDDKAINSENFDWEIM
jgi:uncharacterized HAD superfamily protein